MTASANPKIHKVEMEILELDKSVNYDTLDGFIQGTGWRLLRWGQTSEHDLIYKGLMDVRGSNTEWKSLIEGEYVLRLRDRIFFSNNKESLLEEWGIEL